MRYTFKTNGGEYFVIDVEIDVDKIAASMALKMSKNGSKVARSHDGGITVRKVSL